MFLGASNFVFERAKALRADPTHAEMILWQHLRHKPQGHKFRRQHPISIYVVDFYCHSLNLIIEVDGRVHADPEIAKHDSERQQNLQNEGLSFLRFTNEAIEKNLPVVIEAIDNYITNHKLNEQKDTKL